MRALVVSNMQPDRAHPQRGRFVRDQVDALRGIDGVDVELYEFPPGKRELARAAWDLRRRYGRGRLDVVHAHFGLTAWPALAASARVRALTVHGTDLSHPRTRSLTARVIPRMDILAAASAPLAERLPVQRERALVLPCGVDLVRFHPIPRADARAELKLDDEPFVLFLSSPSRPEKHYDLALALARDANAEVRALYDVAPELVALWINAANAVLVPSAREGFGLAVLEALACDVPVLATPVGIHPQALANVAGTLCAPFDLAVWRAALGPHLRDPDPRIAGRSHAEPFSAPRLAQRVLEAWRAALERVDAAGSPRPAASSDASPG
ncbi:MAG TPA: glycosyltransferase [Solirubrobacteraceae bacterium]|jgi:teichuronic acid biosynthesis glycosyltransferase TuaC|nr:glycosyltransferase [Solirubrobacteraceae bacterium]